MSSAPAVRARRSLPRGQRPLLQSDTCYVHAANWGGTKRYLQVLVISSPKKKFPNTWWRTVIITRIWGVGGGVEEPRTAERKTRSGAFRQDRSGGLRRTGRQGDGAGRVRSRQPRDAAEDEGASALQGQTPGRL